MGWQVRVRGAGAMRRACMRVKGTPRAIWAVNGKENSEPEAVCRCPYTRLAASLIRLLTLCGPQMWSFQGVSGLSFAGSGLAGSFMLLIGGLFLQSERLQSCRFFTENPAIGLIFHHRLGSVLRALFLPETCFGTRSSLARSGLIRFSWQSHLHSAKPVTSSLQSSESFAHTWLSICIEPRKCKPSEPLRPWDENSGVRAAPRNRDQNARSRLGAWLGGAVADAAKLPDQRSWVEAN
jgi:hypothetical protein